MPTFKTDQALWYNVGVWGELGYAVPNFGDDPTTLNDGIQYLTTVVGRNLSAIMHHPDCDLRTPPSINTLTRIHKLVLRSRQILASRDVAPGEPDMESMHTSPASSVHLIFPVPYFKVRNHHLKQYCGLILNGLAEMMQHTENRKPYEISTRFSGTVGQYFHRVYRLMATELFGIDPERAKELDFTLSDADLKAYDPGKWFTSTEMIDTVAPIHLVPTEDDLVVLTDGIPATQLVGLSAYPSGEAINAGVVGASSSASNTSNRSASFAAPPTP
jgi:hypothetical protein